MDNIRRIRCICLARSFNNAPLEEESTRQEIRNRLFLLMEDDLRAWVGSVLAQKRFFGEESFITSISWDAFLYCLKYYKDDDVPIEKHFYKYTKYYVTKSLSGKEEEHSIEEASVENGVEDCPNNIFHNFLDLKAFRNTLPENYKGIFDEALLTVNNSGPKVKFENKSGLNSHRYNEAKRMMKFFIRFLFRS